MGDSTSPFYAQPSPHPAKSSLPMLYYGLVVVGTAAIVLVLYNFIVIKWCSDHRQGRASPAPVNSSRSLQSSSTTNLLSSFKFKKGSTATATPTAEVAAAVEEEGKWNECAVCLSAFEDGEEVKKLPRCTHMFHSPCIDMWLFSHSDCPLCRAPVAATAAAVEQSENSGQGLLESGELV